MNVYWNYQKLLKASYKMRRLGVNIDHIATLRQARGICYPDPIDSIQILVERRVDQITCHLREDRRHIQDRDLKLLIEQSPLPINMELALTTEMVSICCGLKPHTATFVPEKREEITTEGGLDCIKNFSQLQKIIPQLQDQGIRISLFIDPQKDQIDKALELQVDGIELHTGAYCDATPLNQAKELERLNIAAQHAAKHKLKVFAGHGLNLHNLTPVTQIQEIEEYNIGHAIIARAVFVGLSQAVAEIQEILQQ